PRRLLPLCGELLRLGCDRQEIRMLDEGRRALVRVREPPFFVVARAAEPQEKLTVFSLAADNVWLQLGWHHPLTAAIEPPAQAQLLISEDGRFEAIADAPFTPLDQMIFPVGLPKVAARAVEEQPPR